MSNDKLDPYKILGVNKNCDLNDIKIAYKKLARQTHPDKGGNAYLFQMITLSYEKLYNELKLKEIDKGFTELKIGSRDFIENQERLPKKNKNLYTSSNHNFQETFNKIYDDHKMPNAFDRGYGDMMHPSSKSREDINIKKTVINQKDFHKIFESAPLNKNNKKLIVYKEPTALPAHSGALSYSIIGQDKINDFSGSSDTGLEYTDYRKAYTTTRLIDPSLVKKRKEYDNIQDLDNDRATIKPLTNKELNALEQQKYKERIIEENRRKKIERDDLEQIKLFEKINKLMVGFKV